MGELKEMLTQKWLSICKTCGSQIVLFEADVNAFAEQTSY